MDEKKKRQVLEILNFWKTIEFLNQVDLPVDSSENKGNLKKIANGQKISDDKIVLFSDIQDPKFDGASGICVERYGKMAK